MHVTRTDNTDSQEIEVDAALVQGVPEPPPPVSRGLSGRLAGGTLNYGIGSFLPQLINFLLIPVFTAFLTPKDYGILELAGLLGSVVLLLMRFGIPGAVTRFYFDYKEGPELTDYVTTIARSVNAFSVLVGVTVLAVGYWTISPWMELEYYPFVVLVVVIQLLSSNSDLQRRLIQAREQSAYSAILSIVIAAVTVVFALLFVVVFGWGVAGMMWAQALCGLLFFVQALYYLRPNLGGHFRWEMFRSSFKYAMGILPHHLLSSVSPLLTRVILTRADSLAAVGLFSLASKMASPLTVVAVSAFNSAYLPLYFSIRKESSPDMLVKLATTSRHVWLAALICFLGVGLLGPPAIVLMTPDKFHDASPLVPILTVGFLAQTLYTLLGPEIFYSKRTWLVPVVSAAGLATTLAMSALLVGQFGAVGIAWATSIGQIVTMAVAVYFSLQTVRVPHDWLGLLRATVVAMAVFFTARWIGGDEFWPQTIAGAVAIVVFPLLLWMTGDRSIRDFWVEGRKRLGLGRKRK